MTTETDLDDGQTAGADLKQVAGPAVTLKALETQIAGPSGPCASAKGRSRIDSVKGTPLARAIRLSAIAVLCTVFATLSGLAGAVLDGAGSRAAASEHQTLNYRDADIRAFIDDVSMLTGNTFIVDPRVNGKVTVISNTGLESEALFDVFLATLRVNGYSVVSMPTGAYKILPNTDAMLQAGASGDGVTGDRFVTEVFRLAHIDGISALNLLKPIVHTDGRVVANRGSNFIVVVDYASNMNRIRQVIADVDRSTDVYRSVGLQNTAASEMVRIIGALADGQQGGESGLQPNVTAVAIDASNTVVLRGEERAVARMTAFVRDLDSGNQARERGVRVYRLRHAEAEELLPLLQEISEAFVRSSKEDGAPTGNRGTHIAAHNPTNAIVVHADMHMHAKIGQVIRDLDVRRSQVLVEALIAEVSDTAARDLGLQYLLSGDGNSSSIPFTATNFSNSAPNILAATGALIAENELDSSSANTAISDLQNIAIQSLLGVSGFVGGGAGQTANGTIFGVIITAIQQDTDSNLLSTPSIMTMDNQKAAIIVGQEVPIATGEVVGDDFQNPFRTVSRQDVGVQLDVRPQITEGNSIKLNVRQEVSSVAGPVTVSSSDLIINKRELTTNVMVEDGGIAVLGGLIEENDQITVQQVPVLGDIPILGRLFQSKNKSRTRTNLMVFLRPTIVRSAGDLEEVSGRRYDYMREQELLWRGDDAQSRMDYFRDSVMSNKIPLEPAPAGPAPLTPQP